MSASIKLISTIVAETNGYTVDLKKHHAEIVISAYAAHSKVAAIKFIRAEYDLGLKDAKDLCDEIYLQRHIFGMGWITEQGERT